MTGHWHGSREPPAETGGAPRSAKDDKNATWVELGLVITTASVAMLRAALGAGRVGRGGTDSDIRQTPKAASHLDSVRDSPMSAPPSLAPSTIPVNNDRCAAKRFLHVSNGTASRAQTAGCVCVASTCLLPLGPVVVQAATVRARWRPAPATTPQAHTRVCNSLQMTRTCP